MNLSDLDEFKEENDGFNYETVFSPVQSNAQQTTDADLLDNDELDVQVQMEDKDEVDTDYVNKNLDFYSDILESKISENDETNKHNYQLEKVDLIN